MPRAFTRDTVPCAAACAGHGHAVSCMLELRDGRLVTGSLDTHLRVWNLGAQSCERVIEVHDMSWRLCLAPASSQWLLALHISGASSYRRGQAGTVVIPNCHSVTLSGPRGGSHGARAAHQWSCSERCLEPYTHPPTRPPYTESNITCVGWNARVLLSLSGCSCSLR